MIDILTDNTPLISISTAADILGIHMRTLMLYEYEKLVIPKRSPQNRRMYSHNDLKKLFFIRYLTQTKKLNFAGVRLILTMEEQSQDPEFKKAMFPDFRESGIVSVAQSE